jgi:hypothetical protein
MTVLFLHFKQYALFYQDKNEKCVVVLDCFSFQSFATCIFNHFKTVLFLLNCIFLAFQCHEWLC